jgi:NADH:ubiquinone oxidoreductase subunit 5 (subunit L)/multisubunit Na+/H+ antiporter MnhA subunit
VCAVIGLGNDAIVLVYLAPLGAALVLFALARAPWLWPRVVVGVAVELGALAFSFWLLRKILVRGGFAFVDIDGWAGARVDGVDPLGLVACTLTPGTAPLLVAVHVAGALAVWLIAPHALKSKSTGPLAAALAAVSACALLVVAKSALTMCAAFSLASIAGFALLVAFHPQRTDVEGAVRAFLLHRAGDAVLLGAMFLAGAALGPATHVGVGVDAGALADLARFAASAVATDPDAVAAGGPLAGMSAANVWLLVGALVVGAASSRLAFGPLLPLVRDAVGAPGAAVGFAHGACFFGAGLVLLLRMTPVLWLAPPALVVLAWCAAVGAVISALFALAGRDLLRIDVHLVSGAAAVAAFAFACADLGTGALGTAVVIAASVPLFAAAHVVIDATGRTDPHVLGGLEKLLPRTHTTTLFATLAFFGPLTGAFVAAHAIAAALFAPWIGPRPAIVLCVAFALIALAAFRPLHLVFTGKTQREPLANSVVEPRRWLTFPGVALTFVLVGVGVAHFPVGVLAVMHSIAGMNVSYDSPVWALFVPERKELFTLRGHMLGPLSSPALGPVAVSALAFSALFTGWLASTLLYRNGPRALHKLLFGRARAQKVVAVVAGVAGRESQVAKNVGENAARLSRLIATNLAPGFLDTLLRRIPTLVAMIAGFVVRFVANGSVQRGLVVALIVLAILAAVVLR